MKKFYVYVFGSIFIWKSLLFIAVGFSVALMIFCPQISTMLITAAVLSFLGIVMGVRPVLRLGVAGWIAALHMLNGGYFGEIQEPSNTATMEEKEEYYKRLDEEQRDKQTIIDYKFQILGVGYIAAGTIINALTQLVQ